MRPLRSVNPYSGETLQEYSPYTEQQISKILDQAMQGFQSWRRNSFGARKTLFLEVASLLEKNLSSFSHLITHEMGKLLREAEAEILKCRSLCLFYAEHGESFTEAKQVSTEAKESFIQFDPLGVVLGIMPWNFPFWQAFRFIIPALAGGNTCILKHASNVSGCALAIEQLFQNLPGRENIVQTLLTPGHALSSVIEDSRISAVTLTGSESAGRKVGEAAGRSLKKLVLELGGSDPFIVLDDCNLESTIEGALTGRLINAGQSCIASKRFIVQESLFEPFIANLQEAIMQLQLGDPTATSTTVAPLARPDLGDDLDRQIEESLQQGAEAIIRGGRQKGHACFYAPSLMTNIHLDMPVWREETFGPVFSVVSACDDDEALALANHSQFGLGATVWGSSEKRLHWFMNHLETGMVFINSIVRSDPRLPFGGIKTSGIGRELSSFGMREFQNAKTVWRAS